MATRAQFSVRMLLAFTAVVAICVAPFIQPPSCYSATAMIAILFVLPSVALCGVYGCRGASRFFFVGCLMPATAGLYLAAQYVMPTEWYRNFQGPLTAHWQVYFQSIAFPIRLATAFVLAANPRLPSLIAHDRAGFGGGVACCGLTMFFCNWCGRPSRSLWQALLLSGVSGFATAIGVHPAIGYNDLFHLSPAIVGATLFTVGIVLTHGAAQHQPSA